MEEELSYSVSVHLGASSLSILVLESEGEEEREIDYLEQAVPLARDIFRGGIIKRNTIERVVDILEGYLTTLKEYGLSSEDVKVAWVSNIANEAKNIHIVLNRLKIATGIEFSPLYDGGMTRAVLMKFRRSQEEVAFAKKGKTLAVHVGPGNTRVLLFNDGKVERYSTYRLGTHRTSESLRETYVDGQEYLQVIRTHCEPQISAIMYDYRKEEIDHMILIGYEIQLVAERLLAEGGFTPSIEKFGKFLTQAAQISERERVSRYALDMHSEDGFLPALQINYSLLHAFQIQDYWVSPSHYERGLLMDLRTTKKKEKVLFSESLRSAHLLAEKYEADPAHYENVQDLVTSLFQQTTEIHGLGEWELHLLQLATILHEIGGFISSRMHHKHSYYLVMHSELFGLNEKTLKIVALVARYHRQSGPKASHKDYVSLSQENQILVGKLSALLRVADSLDVTRQQRIKNVTVKQEKDQLTLLVDGVSEIELEKLTLKKKGDVFQNLFGLQLRLKSMP